MFFTRPVSMPTAEQALPGRPEAILRPGRHTVLDRPIAGPYPEGTEIAVFDPKQVSYEQLLKVFWESHDPTQGMRQGNDVGTQYRSVIFCHTDDRRRATEASRDLFPEPPRDTPPPPATPPPRSPARRRRPSTSPRTTTSSTWTRIREATARITARACPARWGSSPLRGNEADTGRPERASGDLAALRRPRLPAPGARRRRARQPPTRS